MDQRRIILIGALLLSILAATIYWYGETGNDTDTVLAKDQKKQAPETVVNGFRQTTFTELGLRQYHMEASKVIHFTRQAEAAMAQPVVTFFQQPTSEKMSEDNLIDTTEWVAKADSGLIKNEGQSLELSGNVEIIKPMGGGEPIQFFTESLTIKPNKELAETKKPVTIKQAKHITQATGLIIDIAAGKVELLSQVRSQYVPATL